MGSSSAQVFIIVDADGGILQCSPGVCAVTGSREDELVGRSLVDCVEQWVPAAAAILGQTKAKTKRIPCSWKLRCRSHGPIPVDCVFTLMDGVQATPLYYVLMTLDTADVKTVDGASLSIPGSETASYWVVDVESADWPLLYVNPAFVALTGYSLLECVGRPVTFLHGPLTEHASACAVNTALGMQEPCRVSITQYTKDNQPFRTRLTLVPLDPRVWHRVRVSVAWNGYFEARILCRTRRGAPRALCPRCTKSRLFWIHFPRGLRWHSNYCVPRHRTTQLLTQSKN